MEITLDASLLPRTGMIASTSELDDVDALVATYWPRVLRYVMLSVRDRDLAQTIAQDCFLKAHRNRGQFRGDCQVSTWLMTIANNLVRDHMRLKKLQFWRRAEAQAADVTEMAGTLRSTEASAERQMLGRERAELVMTAVAALSAKQRQVFTLRFLESKELGEIASELNMPVNTVKTHLHRAVTTVRASVGSSQ